MRILVAIAIALGLGDALIRRLASSGIDEIRRDLERRGLVGPLALGIAHRLTNEERQELLHAAIRPHRLPEPMHRLTELELIEPRGRRWRATWLGREVAEAIVDDGLGVTVIGVPCRQHSGELMAWYDPRNREVFVVHSDRGRSPGPTAFYFRSTASCDDYESLVALLRSPSVQRQLGAVDMRSRLARWQISRMLPGESPVVEAAKTEWLESIAEEQQWLANHADFPAQLDVYELAPLLWMTNIEGERQPSSITFIVKNTGAVSTIDWRKLHEDDREQLREQMLAADRQPLELPP